MSEEVGPIKYLKDAITILVFLSGIAGIYIKLSEQVVRLEQKVVVLEERTKDLKISNDKLVDKINTLQTVSNNR